MRRTLDNVTVVMISFGNFKRAVFGEGKTSARERDHNDIIHKYRTISDEPRIIK